MRRAAHARATLVGRATADRVAVTPPEDAGAQRRPETLLGLRLDGDGPARRAAGAGVAAAVAGVDREGADAARRRRRHAAGVPTSRPSRTTTRPSLTTARMAGTPTRTRSSSRAERSRTRSARLPASIEPDVVVQVEREGRVHRHRGEGLLERHPHREAGDRHGERQRRGEAAARVHVGGEGHGRAGRDQVARGSEASEAQVEGRGREERRDAGGLGEGLHPGRGDVDEVIGRARAQLAGQLRPAGRGQLVGVDPQLHAVGSRGEQDAPALLDREDALLAEHVGEGGEAALGDRGDHLLDEDLHVAGPVPAVLPRHLVRPEERRHHGDGVARGGEADGLEAPDLGPGLEPVAALHLGRGGAAEQHLVEARGDEVRRAPRRTPRASPRPCGRSRRLPPRSPGTTPRPGAGGSRRRGRRRTRGGCAGRRGRARRRRRAASSVSAPGRRTTAASKPASGPTQATRPPATAIAASRTRPRSRIAAPVRGAGPASVARSPMRRTAKSAAIMSRGAPARWPRRARPR